MDTYDMEMYKMVWNLFNTRRLAPSKIDEALKLPKGSVHSMIITIWKTGMMLNVN